MDVLGFFLCFKLFFIIIIFSMFCLCGGGSGNGGFGE